EIKTPARSPSARVPAAFMEAKNGTEFMHAARKIAIQVPQMNGLAAVRWLSSAVCCASSKPAPARRGIPIRRNLKEILQDGVPVIGGNALGVELHAVHRQLAVGKPHDKASVGLSRHGEFVRHGIVVNHQRMIARCPERSVDAAEYALPAVAHLREL